METKKGYFTTKTAIGNAFCNREKERAQLKLNIQKGEHTVVVAPRRFGKTSLVCQTLQELDVEYAKIDLFCAVYATAICEKIMKGVSEVIQRLMPVSTKTIKFIGSCFKRINIGLKAGEFELQVGVSRHKENAVEQIIDILTGLEKIAKHQNKRIVVFIDEFQDLLKADQSDEILRLTECHPYYLHLLCDKLRDQKTVPSIKQVEEKWQDCLSEQKDKLIADLEPLNATRIKILFTIAMMDGVEAPNGRDFLDTTGLALGTVQKALNDLLGQDFLYQEENPKKIKLVDPLLKLFLVNQAY